MGRTVMPYSHLMESERERLKPFLRALSKEDPEAFDRLFDRAKMHTAPGFTWLVPARWKPSFCPSAWSMGRSSSRFWACSRRGGRRDCPCPPMVGFTVFRPGATFKAFCGRLIKPWFTPRHPISFLEGFSPYFWF